MPYKAYIIWNISSNMKGKRYKNWKVKDQRSKNWESRNQRLEDQKDRV